MYRKCFASCWLQTLRPSCLTSILLRVGSIPIQPRNRFLATWVGGRCFSDNSLNNHSAVVCKACVLHGHATAAIRCCCCCCRSVLGQQEKRQLLSSCGLSVPIKPDELSPATGHKETLIPHLAESMGDGVWRSCECVCCPCSRKLSPQSGFEFIGSIYIYIWLIEGCRVYRVYRAYMRLGKIKIMFPQCLRTGAYN